MEENMTTEISPQADSESAQQSMLDEAQKLLSERMSFVNKLIENNQELEEAQKKVSELEKKQKQVWREAIRAGWSENELKKVGIKDPLKRRTKSKRSTQNNEPTEKIEYQNEADEIIGTPEEQNHNES